MLKKQLSLLALLLLPGWALATTTINQQFSPATISPGDISRFQLTIANDALVPLTEARVTVVFPAQITLATPIDASQTCGFTVNQATPGTGIVELVNGVIPAGTGTVDGICTFALNVTATDNDNHVNTIPANTVPDNASAGYTAMENGVEVFNGTPANATLSVITLQNPIGTKTFGPSPAIEGDPMTLTILLSNPNTNATLPLTSFTDTLPAGMTVANPAAGSVSCTGNGAANGTVTATPGSGSVTLDGGVIGENGACTLRVNVIADITGTSATLTNTVPAGAIGNSRGLTSAAFSRAVTVNSPLTVQKNFSPNQIPANQPTLLTITLNNRSQANAIPVTSFTDALPAGMRILTTASSPIAAPAEPLVQCTGTGAVNGALTADNGGAQVELTNASIGVNGQCSIQVYVTSAVDGSSLNQIPEGAVNNPQGFVSSATRATLAVNAQLTVGKTVSVSNVAPRPMDSVHGNYQ